MEPKNFMGEDFSRVTQVYRVAQYNIACCYSAINQVCAWQELQVATWVLLQLPMRLHLVRITVLIMISLVWHLHAPQWVWQAIRPSHCCLQAVEFMLDRLGGPQPLSPDVVQVDAGLEALRAAMSAGFEQYGKIRSDANLDNLRKSPKFKPLVDEFDEPVISEGAIKYEPTRCVQGLHAFCLAVQGIP